MTLFEQLKPAFDSVDHADSISGDILGFYANNKNQKAPRNPAHYSSASRRRDRNYRQKRAA